MHFYRSLLGKLVALSIADRAGGWRNGIDRPTDDRGQPPAGHHIVGPIYPGCWAARCQKTFPLGLTPMHAKCGKQRALALALALALCQRRVRSPPPEFLSRPMQGVRLEKNTGRPSSVSPAPKGACGPQRVCSPHARTNPATTRADWQLVTLLHARTARALAGKIHRDDWPWRGMQRHIYGTFVTFFHFFTGAMQ